MSILQTIEQSIEIMEQLIYAIEQIIAHD